MSPNGNMGKKFDYRKAEDDLYNLGCHNPDEIYAYRSEKDIKRFMDEHGLDADKYYKNTGSPSGGSSSGGQSSGGSSGWFDEPSGGSDEGCYITTACVRARGLSDSCDELETLRRFRDGFAKDREGGRRDIARYYRTAPEVVKAIDRRGDASLVWDGLYRTLVLPCVGLVKAGRYGEAYELYKSRALELEREYL